VVTVIIAIASEVISLVWIIKEKMQKFVSDLKKKKQDKILKKISIIEKKAKLEIGEEPVNMLVRNQTKSIKNVADAPGEDQLSQIFEVSRFFILLTLQAKKKHSKPRKPTLAIVQS
jgi:hypothetical protein